MKERKMKNKSTLWSALEEGLCTSKLRISPIIEVLIQEREIINSIPKPLIKIIKLS